MTARRTAFRCIGGAGVIAARPTRPFERISRDPRARAAGLPACRRATKPIGNVSGRRQAASRSTCVGCRPVNSPRGALANRTSSQIGTHDHGAEQEIAPQPAHGIEAHIPDVLDQPRTDSMIFQGSSPIAARMTPTRIDSRSAGRPPPAADRRRNVEHNPWRCPGIPTDSCSNSWLIEISRLRQLGTCDAPAQAASLPNAHAQRGNCRAA